MDHGPRGIPDDRLIQVVPQELHEVCEHGLFETGADSAAATRLGLSDVRMELASPFPSPFGPWRIEAIVVPGWLALSLNLPGDAQASWCQRGAEVELEVENHGARFTYGSFGLAPLQGERPT